MIIYDNDSDILKNKLFELILPSLKQSEPIYTQKDALKYISLHTKDKEIFNVIDIINKNFLPNYISMDDSDKNLINNYLEKGKFLGYCIRKILLTHLNIYKKTDRDSYINKRIQ